MKVVKVAVYMLLMGVVLWWAMFLVMPVAIQWEVAPAVVERLPIFGFVLGAAVGLGMSRYDSLRQFVWLVFGSIFAGWLIWLFLVTVIGLGLSFGGAEDETFDRMMETVSAAVFWVCTLLVLAAIGIGAFVFVHDKAGALLERFRPKPPKTR